MNYACVLGRRFYLAVQKQNYKLKWHTVVVDSRDALLIGIMFSHKVFTKEQRPNQSIPFQSINHTFSRDYSTQTINTTHRHLYAAQSTDTELSQYTKSVNQTKHKSVDYLFAEFSLLHKCIKSYSHPQHRAHPATHAPTVHSARDRAL